MAPSLVSALCNFTDRVGSQSVLQFTAALSGAAQPQPCDFQGVS